MNKEQNQYQDEMRNKIYLAALLHDIGKFWQRADRYDESQKKWMDIDKTKFREEDFCPSNPQGIYSHKHVLWTAQFIEDILKTNERNEFSLLRLSAKHHAPSNKWEKIIQIADHHASGMDRSKIDENIHEDDFGDWRKTPMVPIFERIGVRPKKNYNYRYPIRRLSLQDVMPVDKKDVFLQEDSYHKLWEEFVNEVNNYLKKLNLNQLWKNNNFIDTLYFILQKYTTYIPSSTQDFPDISLFDHSKSVASFAVSLYDYIEENEIQNIDGLTQGSDAPYLLVGADLSGIQRYIYNIKSKNAAKNLKGRSFMLHLITSHVSERILNELNLFTGNLVYNSGGGFFMIVPNTKKVIEKLDQLSIELEKEFLKIFGGELYLGLDYVPLSGEDIMDKHLSDKWSELFGKLSEKKSRKFLHAALEDYQQFFIPQGDSGDILLDDFTGEPIVGDPIELDNNTFVNKVTYQQIQIGKKLKQTKYWYIVPNDQLSAKYVEESDFEFFGLSSFLSDEPISKLEGIDSTIRYRLSHLDFLEPVYNANVSYGFELYGGNNFPTDENGEIKTFDQLPKNEYNKLGIVRMDVDNLGLIFKTGFESRERTMGRYTTLSRQMDLFFKGYINHLWESNEEYKNHIFILYSGGDDIFFLGDWDIARQFAEQLRTDFKRFVCENPLISISGGEYIVPPKYPILKASEESEYFENLAKKYERKNQKVQIRVNAGEEEKIMEINHQKNAFGFLSHTSAMGWDEEYPEVKEMAGLLRDKIAGKALPKTLLHQIMYFSEELSKSKRAYWLLAYQFGRMKKRYKNEAKLLDQIIKDLSQGTWKEQYRDFAMSSREMYAVAARWAELWLRDKEEKEQELATYDFNSEQ